MLDKEFQLLNDIIDGKIINVKATANRELNPDGNIVKEKFNFLHNFIISKVKIMTQEDLIRAKKTNTLLDSESESRVVEVSLDEIDDVEEVDDDGMEEDYD